MTISDVLLSFIDPPGHGRIGGHYYHTWCPSVRKTKNAATPGTTCADNGNLLAVAWWVIFNSLDLFLYISKGLCKKKCKDINIFQK